MTSGLTGERLDIKTIKKNSDYHSCKDFVYRFMTPPLFKQSYVDKWKHAVNLYAKNETDGVSKVRKYFCHSQLQGIQEPDARMIDFFQSLISLHQSLTLDEKNRVKRIRKRLFIPTLATHIWKFIQYQ